MQCRHSWSTCSQDSEVCKENWQSASLFGKENNNVEQCSGPGVGVLHDLHDNANGQSVRAIAGPIKVASGGTGSQRASLDGPQALGEVWRKDGDLPAIRVVVSKFCDEIVHCYTVVVCEVGDLISVCLGQYLNSGNELRWQDREEDKVASSCAIDLGREFKVSLYLSCSRALRS